MESDGNEELTYGVTARCYLERARRCLDANNFEALFYAAFEIRCGIESRMREYLRAQANVSKKKKNGWRTAQLARDIEAVFRTGDRYVIITILDARSGAVLRSFVYTPVRASLRDAAERIGDLLHARKRFRYDSDPWWPRTRVFLESTWSELELATRGELLGVPLLRPDGQLLMQIEFRDNADEEFAYIRKGARAVLGVEYFDGPPTILLDGPSA